MRGGGGGGSAGGSDCGGVYVCKRVLSACKLPIPATTATGFDFLRLALPAWGKVDDDDDGDLDY